MKPFKLASLCQQLRKSPNCLPSLNCILLSKRTDSETNYLQKWLQFPPISLYPHHWQHDFIAFPMKTVLLSLSLELGPIGDRWWPPEGSGSYGRQFPAWPLGGTVHFPPSWGLGFYMYTRWARLLEEEIWKRPPLSQLRSSSLSLQSAQLPNRQEDKAKIS